MSLDDIELARAAHVLFVAHWIGGVSFVTLIALPLARAEEDARKGWALFESSERVLGGRCAWSIPLAGATGLWMAWRLDLWAQLADPGFWWLDAMALVWALFMVFRVRRRAARPPPARGEAARDPESPPAALLRRATSSCSRRRPSRSSARSPGAHGGLGG